MKYQIDQSIKIENTNKTTFVSIANDEIFTVSISSRDKQELKFYFRELEKPLIFKIFTFSVLCVKLITKSKSKNLTIDREYIGHERLIKSFIIQILKIEGVSEPQINFTEIGKSSTAHITAYKAMKNKNKGISVSAKEILMYYDKINKS